ncbi:MAG: AAA domain-containing protein, partial [Intestinibacter sp.]|uniref:3'-5' exonuclease n=1 Tax=Intestinibacter sp. TaxID=1965304 RepID=UPI0025B894F0
FIMLDKSNVYKKVVSYKRNLFREQCKFTTDIVKTLDEIGKKENYKKVSVYILGRYEDDRDKLKNENNRYLSVYPNDNIVYKKNKNLDIKFLTVHKAKGMEADYVIILNCEDSNKNNKMKGFPTNIQDDPILDIVLPKVNRNEHCVNQNSEERRLFYVAITRAKKQVFLNIPKEKENRSIYVKEIESIKNRL